MVKAKRFNTATDWEESLRVSLQKTPNPNSTAELGTSSQGQSCANHAGLEMRRMVILLLEEAWV